MEEVEGEFWRIVENYEDAEEEVVALYGQDLDSGQYGSGFPLPEWRKTLLHQQLQREVNKKRKRNADGVMEAQDEYANHPWNVNNMPCAKGSLLKYLKEDGLISGVMVPWLYVGSCLSAFCWHIEDHGLYSVNYLHMGSPKVWYSVPAWAGSAFENAMRDALPHLFEANHSLLYSLVTMLSPQELVKRGVPVYRTVHEAGSFIITMPNCYHSGFNTGFNCAEAVNFAAPEWLPYGSLIVEKYRESKKEATISHDSLLLKLILVAAKLDDGALASLCCSEAKGIVLGLFEFRKRLKECKEDLDEMSKKFHSIGFVSQSDDEKSVDTTDRNCEVCGTEFVPLWSA